MSNGLGHELEYELSALAGESSAEAVGQEQDRAQGSVGEVPGTVVVAEAGMQRASMPAGNSSLNHPARLRGNGPGFESVAWLSFQGGRSQSREGLRPLLASLPCHRLAIVGGGAPNVKS